MRRALAAAGTIGVLLCPAPPAQAQGLALNPDALAVLEQPMAVRWRGVTLHYSQLLDLALAHDFLADETRVDPRAEIRLSAERQLPNAITIGATYSGAYADAPGYRDRWGVFVGGVFGQLSFGEVAGTVREVTRRNRGTGNAELEFDDVIGGLEEDALAVAYGLRLSAFTLNLAVDENGHPDLGITYDRPGRHVDYRLTARYTAGTAPAANGVTTFDTDAVGLVGQIGYGRLLADVGLGYEWLDGPLGQGDRRYVSAGLHYKLRRLSVSAEGHVGETDGNSETSIALGTRFDVARGLSVNLGYNHASGSRAVNGIPIDNVRLSEIVGSLRYEF